MSIIPERSSFRSRVMQESTRLPPVDSALRGRAKWMLETVSLVEEIAPNELVLDEKGAVVEERSTKDSGKGKHILCIGAGKGHEMEAILNEFPGVKVTGLDPHDNIGPPVEARMKEAGHDVQYLHETVHAGEMKEVADGSVDAATLFFVMHHVEPAEYAGVMSELRRVLKENGKVYVAEDLVDSEEERKVVEWEDKKANFELFGHSPHNYKSEAQWREFFDKEGFIMKRTKEVKPGKVRHGFYVLVKKVE